MSFSTWMSARGQDTAVLFADIKKMSKSVADVTVSATKDVGAGFSAFKTGYDLKKVDNLCSAPVAEEKK